MTQSQQITSIKDERVVEARGLTSAGELECKKCNLVEDEKRGALKGG